MYKLRTDKNKDENGGSIPYTVLMRVLLTGRKIR